MTIFYDLSAQQVVGYLQSDLNIDPVINEVVAAAGPDEEFDEAHELDYVEKSVFEDVYLPLGITLIFIGVMFTGLLQIICAKEYGDDG